MENKFATSPEMQTLKRNKSLILIFTVCPTLKANEIVTFRFKFEKDLLQFVPDMNSDTEQIQ